MTTEGGGLLDDIVDGAGFLLIIVFCIIFNSRSSRSGIRNSRRGRIKDNGNSNDKDDDKNNNDNNTKNKNEIINEKVILED